MSPSQNTADATPDNNNGPIHSHRLFLPQSAAAVLFGALGARGAPVAIGGGACACCLGLVSARELAGTEPGNEGAEGDAGVDLVAVSIEGPADATAAAAAEMISVARRAAEEAAGGGAVSAGDAASGGKWTYCDEAGARRGAFPWPQVLRWARRGFWQPGFPLRDVASGGILPSALAVAAMAFLFPAVAQAAAAQAASQQQQQQQQQQQMMMMMMTQQQQQFHQQQHHHRQPQQQPQQPTAMATEAPPLAVPAQPRPSPVIHHLFAQEEEMTMAAMAAPGSSPGQRAPPPPREHPQQPGKSRMNIADALSILGRSGVGGGGGGSGGGGGGGGRRRGGGGGGGVNDKLPPPPARSVVPVPAAAYAPAVAAYRPPAAAGSGRHGATAATTATATAASSSSSFDPRSLAAALDGAVVSSLAPAVALRLRAVHGDLWLDVLPEPLPWRTPEAVLSVLKATWRSSFENGYASSASAATRARAAAAVGSLPQSLRAARAGRGPAVGEAACALADLVRDFPSSGGGGGNAGSARGASSEEAAAVAAALARARAAAASAASKAASAGWM